MVLDILDKELKIIAVCITQHLHWVDILKCRFDDQYGNKTVGDIKKGVDNMDYILFEQYYIILFLGDNTLLEHAL